MATTTDPVPPADTPPDAHAAPKGTAGAYQYLDEIPRTYCFTDGTVYTPNKGDVCDLPYDPGDGRWQPSKAKVTRLPDNHPEQTAKNAAAQAAERARVLAAAAETGKASA